MQKAAVEKLAEDYGAKAAWVEVTERYGIADWQYNKAEEGEPGSVLINLSPNGKVEIREGLAKSACAATRTGPAVSAATRKQSL